MKLIPEQNTFRIYQSLFTLKVVPNCAHKIKISIGVVVIDLITDPLFTLGSRPLCCICRSFISFSALNWLINLIHFHILGLACSGLEHCFHLQTRCWCAALRTLQQSLHSTSREGSCCCTSR